MEQKDNCSSATAKRFAFTGFGGTPTTFFPRSRENGNPELPHFSVRKVVVAKTKNTGLRLEVAFCVPHSAKEFDNATPQEPLIG